MIEPILPSAAVVVEAGEDRCASGEDGGRGPGALFPQEEAMIARAVDGRRREFAAGRDCARRALELLGAPVGPILAGKRGEPIWPAGVVGSITHCRGYRGCAVAAATDLSAIGIDAEPHEPLPEGLLARLAGAEEMSDLEDLTRAGPEIAWDRLLFSAKESLYKAWYPLTERRLGFEDTVLTIDPEERSFSARSLLLGPTVAGAELTGFEGRWLVADGLVLTAVTVSS